MTTPAASTGSIEGYSAEIGHAGRGSRVVTATCAYCGVGFSYHRRRAGGNPRRYCTRRHRILAALSDRPRRTCRRCGRSFVVRHHHQGFCSKTCARRHATVRAVERNRARYAQRKLFPEHRCPLCDGPIVTPGARACGDCYTRRSKGVLALYPKVVDGRDVVCPACAGAVHPQTEDGVLVDWCPRCRRAWPVPVRGHRTHDQRERLEREMGAAVARETNPVALTTTQGKPTTRIVCGKYAA